MLSQTEENYLKALLKITLDNEHGEAGTNELAASLSLKPATVNDMLKKLKEKLITIWWNLRLDFNFDAEHRAKLKKESDILCNELKRELGENEFKAYYFASFIIQTPSDARRALWKEFFNDDWE